MFNRYFTVFFQYRQNVEDVPQSAMVSFGYNKFPHRNRIKEIIKLMSNKDIVVITNILEMSPEDFRSFNGTNLVNVFDDKTDLQSILNNQKKEQ